MTAPWSDFHSMNILKWFLITKPKLKFISIRVRNFHIFKAKYWSWSFLEHLLRPSFLLGANDINSNHLFLKMSLKCNKRWYHVCGGREAIGYTCALFLNHYENRKGIFIIMAKVFYKYCRVYVFLSSVACIPFISFVLFFNCFGYL